MTAAEEWKRNWSIVLAAAFGFSFMSFMSPAMGLFMAPLQEEFGWSRALLSSGTAIGAAISLLVSPFFGALIDRFGSRRLALVGITATSLSIAAFSTMSGDRLEWILLWFLFGFTSMTIHATTWTTAVAGVFERSRGLALGVTLSGSALASAIVPPLTNWTIATFGWREAYAGLGIGWGAMALLLCALFLYDAHDFRRENAKQADPATVKAASVADLTGLSIREAWRAGALWRVGIATLLTLTVTIGVIVHQVPIVVSAGFTRTDASWLASLAGIAGIVGKLATGTLIDRFHVRWVGGATLASTAIAYPMLVEPFSTPMLIVVAMLINGYAAGTKLQLCGYLTARYAGMKHYGAIFGMMSSLIALAGGLGPILAGLAFDANGDYAVFLWAAAAISLISGLLIFSLGPYPDWEDK